MATKTKQTTDAYETELAGLATVSAKIRFLDAKGMSRAEIAKYLGKRYQHVRNVLTNLPKKTQ